MIHNPFLLFIPLAGIIFLVLILWLLARPLSISAYLRTTQLAQERYQKLYIPFFTLPEQGGHHLITGLPGSGKTMLLRAYLYTATQNRRAIAYGRSRIPIYIPLQNVSLFLKTRTRSTSSGDTAGNSLIDFLQQSDLPGIRRIQRYLKRLAAQGRLELLCDGLDEIDPHYADTVITALDDLVRQSSNRLVITSRAIDDHAHPQLIQLVDEGLLDITELPSLQSDQVRACVEHYISQQNDQWRYTAGQIMEAIEHCRLRYHCANPMLLFSLLKTIDKAGIEQSKQSDTRGLQLHELVSQLIESERKQPQWGGSAPTVSTILTLLSTIACAARWSNDRNAIHLHLSSLGGRASDRLRATNLAWSLQAWLDEHPPQGPFARDIPSQPPAFDRTEVARMLQCAQGAGLIEISPQGILSFAHTLIAEYLVAEYFAAQDNAQQPALRDELLANAPAWSEVIALWAGLLDDPMQLASHLAEQAGSNSIYTLEVLALSLVCLGAGWSLSDSAPPIAPPEGIEELLAGALGDEAAREQLAHMMIDCAAQGAQEIYFSLLPLLMLEGIEDLLILLAETPILTILFDYLSAIVDNAAYDVQVRRLIRLLSYSGETAVALAAQLSEPAPERSIRLRAAMVNILGGTASQLAVEPVLARLDDPDPFIRGRASSALIRLGPDYTLPHLLQALEQHPPVESGMHQAILSMLDRFLNEQEAQRQVTPAQREEILAAILRTLSSQHSPEALQQAISILAQQGSLEGESGAKVLELLLHDLAALDEVSSIIQTLQLIGPAVTPLLLERLQQQPSEILRMRIVNVFAGMQEPDQRALPYLLRMLSDPSPLVQQQLTFAMYAYTPASISELVKLVLFDADDAIAARAAEILGEIGEGVVAPVIQALPHVIPERTRLLVQVLERVHDSQAVPALIDLLQTPTIEPLLAIAIVRALSQYADMRVVQPLIALLSSDTVQLYEEAINALSRLGEIAFSDLLAALNVEEETPATPRVRRALLGMVPFPGEQLIDALAYVGDAQAQQVVAVLLAKGGDAAPMLVGHLADPNQRIQDYAHYALSMMEGQVVVPALLEVLHRPELRPVIDELLHMYPQEAIPPLTGLLQDDERGDAAATILLKLGPVILPWLLTSIDETSAAARERARHIIADMVRQEPRILPQVVRLFNLPLPEYTRADLLDVLTNSLADLSTPALLEGLEDAHLIEGVSQAFALLIQKRDSHSEVALKGLFDALQTPGRQRGAKIVLANVGEPAVPGLINLIADDDTQLAQTAQDILRDIGIAAFPAIWAACSDINNPAQREAALNTFRSMPTVEIKDGLIEHLMGDSLAEISMALGLLLERINDEASLPRSDQQMIRSLLEHLQTQNEKRATRRIISLLLLIGGSDIVNHMAWGLYHYHDQPGHQQELTRTFLLLGDEAEETLLEMLRYRGTPPQLMAEVVSVLGMMAPRQEVQEYARTIANPDSSIYQPTIPYSDRRAIALRALGGLLAGGHLNSSTLADRQTTSLYGSAEHELYSVLLGKPYGPLITRLENDMRSAEYEFEKERRQLTIQLTLLEHEKEELEDQIRELEMHNRQLEGTHKQLIESNERLQQMLRRGPDAGQ